MIAGITIKVCGITSVDGAAAAAGIGVDYLGFNLYPKSPRYLAPEKYSAMKGQLPAVPRVAVLVEPTADELQQAIDLGFDTYQIHFRAENGNERPAASGGPAPDAWGKAVGVDRLWLAPRLPPEAPLAASLLPLADTFLIDTFHRGKFGGTGETGDWKLFAGLRQSYPGKTWILAGGLGPANIRSALAATGARFIDVNSGVESAPGIKDPAKLDALANVLAGGTYP